MKLKKLLALACAVVMSASLFASATLVADAAVDGATATLEFAGYEVKGTTTFAKINVKATIPDTLVPYELVAADWVETFEDTYKGLMVQSVGFDIPNVSGLTYVASLSSAAEYVQIQDNKTASKLTIYAANTGAYETYYAGTVDTLATLYYRITGDVNGEYAVNLTDAVIGLVNVNADGSVTPKEYTFNDFTVTNAVVKPEVTEPTTYAVTVVGGTADVAEAEEGDTVTVTPAIPEGKQIASVTGAEVTAQADGTYTFTMPAEAVTITITYEDIPVPEFTASAAAGADMYFVPNGATEAKTVKTFDVTVANSVDGLVSISIGDSKTRSVEVPQGETTTDFTMLIFNVPTDVKPIVKITD